MISQRFPGTFQNGDIRQHLKQRWGFKSGRQDSVLLMIANSPPQSRLPNDADAKSFIDNIVQLYITKTGLILPSESAPMGGSEIHEMVSSEVVESMESRQKTVLEEQLRLYARLIGVDLYTPYSTQHALCQRISELEGQLDEWNVEHGEEYASGIQQIFSPLKARHYDSWWNWAMQDLLVLISMVSKFGRKSIHGWDYDDELSRILHDVLGDATTMGLCFSELNVLVTGAGVGSIGCELVAKLLTAGAHVVVTSSSYSPKVTRFYQDLFAEHGEGMEKLGVRTYSRDEMAFNILSLMHPTVVSLCIDEPLLADLSGGMALVADLKCHTSRLRDSINQISEERKSMALESTKDSPFVEFEADIEPQANIVFEFPPLPDWTADIQPLTEQLQGLVDLDRVAVVTGFSEVGPWGNSRVRWDMEVNGTLSLESCIELAWIMGLVKAHSGTIDGHPYSGWIDAATGQPIEDGKIRDKYETYMLQHSGIRFAEPKQGSQSWTDLEALHEVEILRDQDPIDVSNETAGQLLMAHGNYVQITAIEETGQSRIVLKKGAKIMIPKLLPTPQTVAGQIPTGWEPSTYGVPEEIIMQVDPVTLYALVAAAEAFQSAGISVPYELYNHLHVTDVANCVGSGFGGISSMRKIFKERYQDQPAAKDVLAESFISSSSAWINMLLLSAAGANKTPVGACATALESLDTACDLIQAGKAKVCLAGGFDDMLKEISEEFANLKATMNADEDLARGRGPSEMSRPATATRNGFIESEGAGIQIITSASVALKMGLPIYGVVALTRTAMDKASRSIPAPGRGLLGAAIQHQDKYDSPLMSMEYRKRSLRMRMQQALEMRQLQLSYLEEEIDQLKREGHKVDENEYRQQRVDSIEGDAIRDKKEAQNLYGNQFWIHDNRIAPIRGALAVWGLTVDDIDVVSFHGTSTKANERNEAAVINEQFRHLGRKKGNVVPVVCQKALTGHPKGAAGAWMLNGCMQLMHDGKIPGNRNADNIDAALEEFDYLVFPNKNIDKPEVKAFITQSFGFGQKGSMAIGVHPKYLFATMQQQEFTEYEQKRRQHERMAIRNFYERMSNNSVFQAKETSPHVADDSSILLDPTVRAEC
ncbi:hypothetical protein RJ55_07728 [Drechmeria coniospora]|nr:hypothetical protein RJ55_07728 [Drechmeria coniospora]